MKTATVQEYLNRAAMPRKALEKFLDPGSVTWAKFDGELGYVLSPCVIRDGVDGCRSVYTYEPGGARRMVHSRGRPCRINTYGDSFTQCHQVSDGETWQEVLAAHFGEPIRNFGVGGYGVYQAYRRMRRVEAGPEAAPYVVLNIYDDDHYRNLTACRWVHVPFFYATARDGTMFHGTPWVHVRVDPARGKWLERENPFSTPQSVRRLCDARFMYETYRNDPVVKLEVLRAGGQVDDTKDLQELADFLAPKLDLSAARSRRAAARDLLTRYALASSRFVVDLARKLAASRGKKLMILLSYGQGNVLAALKGKERFDRSFVEYLASTGLPVVDSLACHVADFKAFRLGPEEYCRRYYIGHYNPAGNHFFAFAIKEAMVKWLKPRPPTYATADVSVADFVAGLA